MYLTDQIVFGRHGGGGGDKRAMPWLGNNSEKGLIVKVDMERRCGRVKWPVIMRKQSM